MIRLNDINKTVISESKVVAYDRFADNYYDSKTGINKNMEVISLFVERHYIKALYESKEARDKDIELLDKIFEVKSIEDKANEESKPSYDFGEPVECEPKQEEYITWNYVKQTFKEGTKIKVEMPNGDNRFIFCDDGDIIIARNDCREGRIYTEDLFNALMLKKVK
jgi:hypothetical protein